MAVTLIQLAASLRLGDGVIAPTEPVAGILSRLLGVSQAFVALAAPAAPEVIADEAITRMAAYLYDSPTAASGDRYAAAWRNSGAEALVSRWVVRRAGSDGEVVGPSTGGLDDEQVRAIVESLIGEHADQENMHHTPPEGGDGAQAVVVHNAASDSHEDIRESITGRVTQDQVEEAANRLINAAGHATNVGLAEANAAIQRNSDALVQHEGTPHGGGNGGTPTPATPTPPVVLVNGAAYTAHGDVTAAGWRDYDFVQLFYAVGGNTYMTPPVSTVQLIAFTSLIVPVGRNVSWTLSIDAADDDRRGRWRSPAGRGFQLGDRGTRCMALPCGLLDTRRDLPPDPNSRPDSSPTHRRNLEKAMGGPVTDTLGNGGAGLSNRDEVDAGSGRACWERPTSTE